MIVHSRKSDKNEINECDVFGESYVFSVRKKYCELETFVSVVTAAFWQGFSINRRKI